MIEEKSLRYPTAKEVIAELEWRIDDPWKLWEAGLEIYKEYNEREFEISSAHLQAMCVAYLMSTGLDPEEIVLVKEHSSQPRVVKWRFTRKSDIDDNTIHDTEAV